MKLEEDATPCNYAEKLDGMLGGMLGRYVRAWQRETLIQGR
jgi:hypothetical protein